MSFNIFYSFSNNGEFQRNIYEKLSEKLKILNVNIIDVDNYNGSYDIDNKIFEQIAECDLFIADITNETIDINDKPVFNGNVMLELGYALAHKFEEQIIMLYNMERIKPEQTPFIINKKHMNEYNIIKNEDIDDFIEDITKDDDSLIFSHLKNLLNFDDNYKWIDVNYIFDNDTYNTLKKILNTTDIKIKINKEKQRIIIVSASKSNKKFIDINKKCSWNNDFSRDILINDMLKHIEIMITMKYLI
jgi:hypothetical protein